MPAGLQEERVSSRKPGALLQLGARKGTAVLYFSSSKVPRSNTKRKVAGEKKKANETRSEKLKIQKNESTSRYFRSD